MNEALEKQKDKDDRLRIHTKMAMYAQIAMGSHKPLVSQKKQEELKVIIDTLNHKPRQPKPVESKL